MTLVAHLSDLHLLEESYAQRRGLERYRLAYLSTGVKLDAEARRLRALAALKQARAAGAEHVLVTGDLTEDGTQRQYQILADILAESGLCPDAVTLVPGNHDAYAEPDAWERALRGPLLRFSRTSRRGAVTVLDHVTIRPVSTVIEKQTFTLSLGEIRKHDVEEAKRVAGKETSRKPTLLAMHHPPLGLRNPLMNAVDGIRGARPMRDLLLSHPTIHVAHGHIHKVHDRCMEAVRPPQVFSAPAARDGKQPIRLYRAERGLGLHPVAEA